MKSTPFELSISQWFNTKGAITLEQLKGRVVVVGAFQMLCPACVAHSIPQLKKMQTIFKNTQVVVIGLHTVFEHHAAMQPHALEAFIHEYRLSFPIGIDRHTPDEAIPQTMKALNLRGTPSTVIFDTAGEICFHEFGHVDDLVLGLTIGQLLATANGSARA
jgi:thiol-disulfide isomerase/thioredoxin